MGCVLVLPSVRRLGRLAFFTSAVAAASGCYPVTHLQGPRTVAPHEVQVAAAAGWQPPNVVPIDLAIRYGAHDRADVSFRLRPALVDPTETTFELGGKLQILRGDAELSVAPSFVRSVHNRAPFNDYISVEDYAELTYGRLSLLIGTNADDVGSLWFGPTIDAGQRTFSVDNGDTERSEPLVAIGSTIGIGIRVASQAQLLIQGGVMTGVAGPGIIDVAGSHYQTVLGPGSVIGEVALGILLGAFR